MSTEINAQKKLLEEINKLCYPIELAAQDSRYIKYLLKGLGWDLDTINGFPLADLTNAITNTYNALVDVKSLLLTPPETISDFINCLGTVNDLFTAVKNIQNFISSAPDPHITAAFKTEFLKLGADLLDFLICGYLEAYHVKLYASLCVLGIITPSEVVRFTEPVLASGEAWVRLPYLKSTIQLNKINSLLANPAGYFKTEYYPASGILDTETDAKAFSHNFFPRLGLLFQALGFDAYYGIDENDAALFTTNAFAVLRRSFTVVYDNGTGSRFGATFSVSPASQGGNGLVIKLFGNWTLYRDMADWLLKINASGGATAFSINTDGIHFPAGLAVESFLIFIQLARINDSISHIGSTAGTRMSIKEMDVNARLNYSNNRLLYGFESRLMQFEFFISSSDGDGFMKKIIPDGIGGKFDLSIGWNNINGLQFGGSGGLEIHLPAHVSVGPIDFNGLTLGIGLDSGTIPITAGSTIVAKLGPIVATVENMGIKCTLSFPASGGNLGIANAAIGFKPPDGIGLKIKASMVEGGGYLYIDKDKGRYSGALELKIASKLSLTAIGIITTKNPDGTDGFSLLVLICVTFSPSIAIGFGFSLSGVGGMVGMNRSMAPEPLRQGVKTGAINNILFPQNIIENIQTIITDLDQVFPVQKDRYTFGLFFLLGWGVPTPLIKIKLGVIIEVPNPVKLAIIGTVSLKLPSEDKAVLQLNVAFAGIIDFDKKYLTFDASIYDSKILNFSLFGDMAVRVFWGDHREILISVGGFHPAYNPPAYLLLPAKMDRLTVSIFNEDNLRLQLATYFAVTSNTVQFGARLDFLFRVSKFQVVGLFGFDVLFQFNPFRFRTDVQAMLAVKCGSCELMSINLDFMLEGPGPWHAKGSASFKVLLTKHKVNFDKTWGPQPATSLPDVAVIPLITADLQKKENWTAALPDQKKLLVQMKELPDTDIVLHPLGTLSITQKIAPLGIKLERFGNQHPSDGGTYDITSVKIQAIAQDTESVLENFAPSQFRNMDDNQKLKADSFEYLRSGVKLKSLTTADLYMDTYVVKNVGYDCTLIDNVHFDKLRMNLKRALVNEFTRGGMIAANTLSRQSRTDLNSPIVKAAMQQENFQLISKDSLKELSTIAGSGIANTKSGSRADVFTLMEKLVQQQPALAGKVQAVPFY